MLPVLTYTAAEAAADALRWRHEHPADWPSSGPASSACTAPPSRGAPSGEECSGYWPAGTAAFHVNADIADAVVRYVTATGDERVRPRSGAGAAGRRRPGCGARSATTTPTGRFRIDGVTGPGRVQRGRRQQRLHQPDGAAEPARRRRRGRAATPTGPTRSASTGRGDRDWRRRGAGDVHPLRRDARRAPPGRGLHPARRSGTSPRTDGRALPAAAAFPLLRPVPQAGRQAGRPGAGHAPARRRVHRRAEGPQLRLLRAAHRPGLVAVGLHPGGRWRPRSATSTWPTTTSPRPR